MSVPEPRSFSLIITAPDVWVPVVETAEESLSFGEVAEDTTLWAFQEQRPERRYLFETERNNVSFLEAHAEDLTPAESWFFSLTTPFDEAGKVESLDLLEDYGEALNNSVFERRVEIFSVREISLAGTSTSLDIKTEALPTQETAVAAFRAAPYVGIEGLVPLEISTFQLGLGTLTPEPISISETGSATVSYQSANVEERTMVEVGTSRTSLNDAVPDAIAVYESGSSSTRFTSVTAEAYQVLEAATSQTTTSDAKTEARTLSEVGFDLLNRFGEDYGLEPLGLGEVSVERNGFFHAQVETISTTEARVNFVSWTHPRTEALGFAEARADSYTSAVIDALTEAPVFNEAAISRYGWVTSVLEAQTLSEAASSENYGFLQARAETLAASESQSSTATWGFASPEVIVVSELRSDFVARAMTEATSEILSASEAGDGFPGTADYTYEYLDLGSVPGSEDQIIVHELVVDILMSFVGQPLVEVGADNYYAAGTSYQTPTPTITAITPSSISAGQSFVVSIDLSRSFLENLTELIPLSSE